MKRRNLLFGGMVLGVVSAGIAILKKEFKGPGLKHCDGDHEPDDDYVKNPPFSMSPGPGKPMSDVVPCKNCGALFAIKTEKLPKTDPTTEELKAVVKRLKGMG